MAGEVGLNIELNVRASKAQIQLAEQIMDDMALYVGIPEKNAGREDGKMNNVQLAYIHSQGSAKMGIPARPFIEPAIELEENREKIARQYKAAFLAALDGDAGGALAALNKAGMEAENAVKTYMGSGALAPNAPITVNGGWMRNKVSGKLFYVKGKGSTAPLIDTGALRSSVTYVIERGGK